MALPPASRYENPIGFVITLYFDPCPWPFLALYSRGTRGDL